MYDFVVLPSFGVRLRAESAAGPYERYVNKMAEYFLSIEKQVKMGARNIYPKIDEYVLLRRETTRARVYCVFTMIPPIRRFCPLIPNKALPYHNRNHKSHRCSRLCNSASDHSNSS